MIFLLIDLLIAAACLAFGHSFGVENCSGLSLLLRLVVLGVESSVLQFVFSISILGVCACVFVMF